ncbi:MAG TPA: tripartite tricarboxylate transporter substrate binding protein [Bacillota bacterium]|nr:tripartite tricarboxylate transporter substrate binding protein [Bacillota bacterium]
MKKISKILAMLLVLTALLSLFTGCSAKESAPADKPAEKVEEKPAVDFPGGKPITLIVGFAPGGGTDVGNRILAPYLEKELNTTITVVNKEGSAGWVSLGEVVNMEPDGYTIAAFNNTIDYAGLNPSTNYTLTSDDFQWLGCTVVDIASVCCRADEKRWSNFKELIEYAKKNELTVTVSGAGTEDQIILELMNARLGTKFVTVVTAGGAAEGTAALLGGHVDLTSANVGEVLTNCREGNFKCLAVFDKERSKFFPDTPTCEEVTGEAIYANSSRGHLMPKGGDPKVVETLVKAYERASKNPEYIEKMAEMGLEVIYQSPEEFIKNIKAVAEDVKSILPALGWDK